MKKRILSLLLTVTMCLSWLTTGALAADNTGVAESEHDHSAWTEWSNENELPDTSGNYYLSVDVTLNSTWTPSDGKTVLCLNGHKLDISSSAADNSSVITVNDNTKLTITDCNTEMGYKFSVNSNTGVWTPNPNGAQTVYGGIITGGAHGVSVSQGEFTLAGGTIVGNGTSDTREGGGVYVNAGEFNMSGGKIVGNSAGQGCGVYLEGKYNSSDVIETYAEFHMLGGEITFNNMITSNMSFAGVVCLADAAKFVFDGGTIKEEHAVDCKYSTLFTMNGGMITYTETQTGGYGVDVSGGEFVMNSGEILNEGTGVQVDSGSLIMNGGNIHKNFYYGVFIVGNNSEFMLQNGSIDENHRYGVWISGSNSTAVMSNGSVCNNGGSKDVNNSNDGGGVIVYSPATISLSGGIAISGNWTTETSSSGTYELMPSNIILQENAVILLKDTLSNQTPLGISTKIMPTEENPVVLIEYNQNRPLTAADVAHFTSDDPNYYVVRTSEGKMVLTTEKPTLEGTVTISGTPKIGQILKVDTAGVTSTIADNLTYKWYRGGETTPIVGATGSSYTPSEAADVGKAIKVEVSATNQSGVLTSTTTDVVAKADYSGTVNTPSVNSKTDTQAIVNKEDGYEYGVTLKAGTNEPASWTMTGIISGLTPNTEYKLWGRVAATDTTEASEAKSVDFTTDKASADSDLQNTLKDAITAYNAPYDGTAHDAFTVGTLPSGWTVQYASSESGSYSDTMPQVTNVSDSKNLWVKFSNSGYSDFVTDYLVSVTARDISGANITLNTAPTYSGTEQTITINKVEVSSMMLTQDTDYTIESGNKATDVAETVLKIKGIGNYTGEASTTWQMLRKSINDAVLASVDSQPYTGSAIMPKPTVTDGSALVENTDFTYSYDTNIYVGTATVKITGQGNYTGEKSTTFAITAVNQNPVITDTVTVTKGGNTVDLKSLVTNAEGVVSFEITGNSNDCSISDGVLTSGANTGIVKITVNIAAKDVNSDGKNEYNDYTRSDAITVTVTDKTPVPLEGGVRQTGCTYGESLTDPTYTAPADTSSTTVTYSGTLRKDNSTYNSATKPTEAGTYTVTVKCETPTHIYKATSAEFTIAPKSITGAEVTLGTALIYNGSAQTQTVTKVELGGTDIISFCTVSENAGTNAGNYTLKVTASNASNYIGEVTKQFTIAKKSITPTIEVSGSYAYNNGAMILPSFTVKDGTATLAENDYAAVITDNVNAGSGKITVTETATGNYTFSETQQSFTINKANYGDKTASGSAKYGTTGSVDLSSYLAEGGNFGTVTATDTNGVFSSTPAMDGNALKFTFVNEASKVSKTATITVPVTGATNYENYEINVTVTVTDKVTPTVTAPTVKTGLVYNDANQVLIDAGSVTGGTLQYSLTSGSDYSTELPKAKNAGNYTVYYKVIGNDDYADVAENSISVSIAKRTISVKADNKSMTVNGTLPAFTVSYGNFASDDSEANVIETEATASCKADGTSVGSFPITVSGTTVLKSGMDTNYEIGTPENGTLTVNSQSSSGGGGGGSAVPTYTVSADKSENGTVSISPKSAAKGDTVTVTVTPDKGYVLETLTVLDKNGKEITLTEKNGKYTFTMPAGKVEVKATFMDDNTMLNYFVDVKTGDYYYDAVLWAAGKGITSGTDTTHFSPNASCTRAQIVTFLWRAAGSPEPKNMGGFTDVSADSYYAKAVAWAVENGITGGTGNNKFSPDAACTREQAVTFLYRASGSPAVTGGSAFTDVAADAYYANAVVWAEQTNITGGIGGNLFGSGRDCTRGQIVTFLYRTMQGK